MDFLPSRPRRNRKVGCNTGICGRNASIGSALCVPVVYSRRGGGKSGDSVHAGLLPSERANGPQA